MSGWAGKQVGEREGGDGTSHILLICDLFSPALQFCPRQRSPCSGPPAAAGAVVAASVTAAPPQQATYLPLLLFMGPLSTKRTAEESKPTSQSRNEMKLINEIVSQLHVRSF